MLLEFRLLLNNIKEILLCLRRRILFENREEIQEKNIIHSRRFFYKKLISNPFRIYRVFTGRELNLKYAEVVITTECTLNCKGCSALMPLYPREKKRHIDFEMITQSIIGLTRIVDSVDKVRLIGGEPLLYPNLYEVLCLIKSQEKIHHAVIVTNGTIMIKDERVINILKDDKFWISISNYGRGNKLIHQLKNERIQYTVLCLDSWKDYGEVTEKSKKRSELIDQFLYCRDIDSQDYSIINGKMYMCPRASHGANLGLIPMKEQEYIDLLDKPVSVKQTKKKVFSFLYKTPYIEACKYCGVSRTMNHIPVAEQV
jgi:organic radical activating enzyme